MKAIFLMIAVLLLSTACTTTDSGGPSSAELEKGINIRQGMDTAELVDLLGEPDYIKPDIKFNKLLMERWHYEIIVDDIQSLQELDTQLVPVYSPAAAGFIEVEEPVPVLVQDTVIQIIDVLIREGKVYAVSSQVQSDFETPVR